MEDHRGEIEKEPIKKRKRGSPVLFLLIFLAGCVFLIYQLVALFQPYYAGRKIYKRLRDQAVTDGKEYIGGFKVDFDELLRLNVDTAGWIRFNEPSIISYPVVKSSDNQEYLTKTFSFTDNKLGTIFVDMRNNPKFRDKNTIIYGHNLQIGGEMFSQLNAYMEESFCRQYPYFYIYTPEGQKLTYQVFSAGIVKSGSDFYKVKFDTGKEFIQWMNMCKNASLYQVSVSLSEDSRVVSLSTCTNGDQSERYIVQGVLCKTEMNGRKGK